MVWREHSLLRSANQCGALNLLEAVLDLTRDQGSRAGQAEVLNTLGQAHLALGDVSDAVATLGDWARSQAAFEQALTLLHDRGDRHGEAECNWLFGLALVQQGQHEKALPLLRAVLAYEQEIGHFSLF